VGIVQGREQGGYPIGCTTTRYHDLAQYEFVGIPPKLEVAASEDEPKRVLEVIGHAR
jgi:hypothetical protein